MIDKANASQDYSDLDVRISDRVYELYGISEQERLTIKNYIAERTGENG